MAENSTETVIKIEKLSTRFGDHLVHSEISLEIKRAEIFAIIGGSGSGKSTLLREIILLHKPNEGSICVLDKELNGISKQNALFLRKRWGVMFQHGGLFGSLNVLENVGLPMREHTSMTNEEIDTRSREKLELSGLSSDVYTKLPSELSGGMLKRASFARALSLDPELLFLDEPTAGLDPESAGGVDHLVLKLRQKLGLTIVMITHDFELLWQVADRVAVLADGKVQAVGDMPSLSVSQNPSIKVFFDSPRGRAAKSIRSEIGEGLSSKPK